MKVFVLRSIQIFAGLTLIVASYRYSYANELKIIDAMGLIRAVKIIRDPVSLRINVQEPSAARAANSREHVSCFAVNTDGLASERSVQADEHRNCVFSNMTAGTWQVHVEDGREWSVFFDE